MDVQARPNQWRVDDHVGGHAVKQLTKTCVLVVTPPVHASLCEL